MIINKLWAALAQVVVTVLAAFVLIPSDEFGVVQGLSLGALLLQAAVTYLLPLLHAGWRGGLKTVASALAGSLTALIPLWTGEPFTAQQIALVVLAGLNALLSETGNYIRAESAKVSDLVFAPPVLLEAPVEYATPSPSGGTMTSLSYVEPEPAGATHRQE